MSARLDLLAVISRAIQVFDTPGFRLLVDRSEFAVDAGNLYGDLLAAYTAIAYRDSEIAALVEADREFDEAHAPEFPDIHKIAAAHKRRVAALAKFGDPK